MRIILSRKGFDSACGGVPSPILPNGTLLSLPIPYAGARHRFGQIVRRGHRLGEFVAALTRGRIGSDDAAHLDPDLCRGDLLREPGWRPAFGQIGAAQTHLRQREVGPGDLFLFFGWFRRAEFCGGVCRYVARAPDVHALFGWLQVGEVAPVGMDLAAHRALWPGLMDHPHLNGHAVPSNTLYIASERLVIDGRDMNVPGGGVFDHFHDGLCLTMPGRSRTVWCLPGWVLPEAGPTLSYHDDPARWMRQANGRCTLRSVAQGQEFVLECSERLPDVAVWMAELLGETMESS